MADSEYLFSACRYSSATDSPSRWSTFLSYLKSSKAIDPCELDKFLHSESSKTYSKTSNYKGYSFEWWRWRRRCKQMENCRFECTHSHSLKHFEEVRSRPDNELIELQRACRRRLRLRFIDDIEGIAGGFLELMDYLNRVGCKIIQILTLIETAICTSTLHKNHNQKNVGFELFLMTLIDGLTQALRNQADSFHIFGVAVSIIRLMRFHLYNTIVMDDFIFTFFASEKTGTRRGGVNILSELHSLILSNSDINDEFQVEACGLIVEIAIAARSSSTIIHDIKNILKDTFSFVSNLPDHRKLKSLMYEECLSALRVPQFCSLGGGTFFETNTFTHFVRQFSDGANLVGVCGDVLLILGRSTTCTDRIGSSKLFRMLLSVIENTTGLLRQIALNSLENVMWAVPQLFWNLNEGEFFGVLLGKSISECVKDCQYICSILRALLYFNILRQEDYEAIKSFILDENSCVSIVDQIISEFDNCLTEVDYNPDYHATHMIASGLHKAVIDLIKSNNSFRKSKFLRLLSNLTSLDIDTMFDFVICEGDVIPWLLKLFKCSSGESLAYALQLLLITVQGGVSFPICNISSTLIVTLIQMCNIRGKTKSNKMHNYTFINDIKSIIVTIVDILAINIEIVNDMTGEEQLALLEIWEMLVCFSNEIPHQDDEVMEIFLEFLSVFTEMFQIVIQSTSKMDDTVIAMFDVLKLKALGKRFEENWILLFLDISMFHQLITIDLPKHEGLVRFPQIFKLLLKNLDLVCSEVTRSNILSSMECIIDLNSSNIEILYNSGFLICLCQYFLPEISQHSSTQYHLLGLLERFIRYSISGCELQSLLRSIDKMRNPESLLATLCRISKTSISGSKGYLAFHYPSNNVPFEKKPKTSFSIDVPCKTWPPSRGYTISLWARFPEMQSTCLQYIEVITLMSCDEISKEKFSLKFHIPSGTLHIFVPQKGDENSVAIITGLSFESNEWYNLVLIHKLDLEPESGRLLASANIKGFIHLYLNGIPIGQPKKLSYPSNDDARLKIVCNHMKEPINEHKKYRPISWHLGNIHLFDDILPDTIILCNYASGPNVIGLRGLLPSPTVRTVLSPNIIKHYNEDPTTLLQNASMTLKPHDFISNLLLVYNAQKHVAYVRSTSTSSVKMQTFYIKKESKLKKSVNLMLPSSGEKILMRTVPLPILFQNKSISLSKFGDALQTIGGMESLFYLLCRFKDYPYKLMSVIRLIYNLSASNGQNLYEFTDMLKGQQLFQFFLRSSKCEINMYTANAFIQSVCSGVQQTENEEFAFVSRNSIVLDMKTVQYVLLDWKIWSRAKDIRTWKHINNQLLLLLDPDFCEFSTYNARQFQKFNIFAKVLYVCQEERDFFPGCVTLAYVRMLHYMMLPNSCEKNREQIKSLLDYVTILNNNSSEALDESLSSSITDLESDYADNVSRDDIASDSQNVKDERKLFGKMELHSPLQSSLAVPVSPNSWPRLRSVSVDSSSSSLCNDLDAESVPKNEIPYDEIVDLEESDCSFFSWWRLAEERDFEDCYVGLGMLALLVDKISSCRKDFLVEQFTQFFKPESLILMMSTKCNATRTLVIKLVGLLLIRVPAFNISFADCNGFQLVAHKIEGSFVSKELLCSCIHVLLGTLDLTDKEDMSFQRKSKLDQRMVQIVLVAAEGCVQSLRTGVYAITQLRSVLLTYGIISSICKIYANVIHDRSHDDCKAIQEIVNAFIGEIAEFFCVEIEMTSISLKDMIEDTLLKIEHSNLSIIKKRHLGLLVFKFCITNLLKQTSIIKNDNTARSLHMIACQICQFGIHLVVFDNINLNPDNPTLSEEHRQILNEIINFLLHHLANIYTVKHNSIILRDYCVLLFGKLVSFLFEKTRLLTFGPMVLHKFCENEQLLLSLGDDPSVGVIIFIGAYEIYKIVRGENETQNLAENVNSEDLIIMAKKREAIIARVVDIHGSVLGPVEYHFLFYPSAVADVENWNKERYLIGMKWGKKCYEYHKEQKNRKERLGGILKESSLRYTTLAIKSRTEAELRSVTLKQRILDGESRSQLEWSRISKRFFSPMSIWSIYDPEAYKLLQVDPTEGPNRIRIRQTVLGSSCQEHSMPTMNKFQSLRSSTDITSSQQSKYSAYFGWISDDISGARRSQMTSETSIYGLGFSSGLKSGDQLQLVMSCEKISPFNCIKCELLFGINHIYLHEGQIRDEDESSSMFYWSRDEVLEIHTRRYLLKNIALEIFLTNGKGILLVFENQNERDRAKSALFSLGLPNFIDYEDNVSGGLLRENITQRWAKQEMSNFEYLMHLNKLAGRSFNDLTMYPVFPHIVADYNSKDLDFNNPKTFRDLSRPMGDQDPVRFERDFLSRFQGLKEAGLAPYFYHTHYSSSAVVLHFLVRVMPYTQLLWELQTGHFEGPDRTFHSMAETWLKSSSTTRDVRELIPEFFYFPDMFVNHNHIDLGVREHESGENEVVDDVILPPWSKNEPRRFISMHMLALESPFVSQNLHKWIDLIFGYKQQGEAAIASHNLFEPHCYEGAVNVDEIESEVDKTASQARIKLFGQTPSQLFLKAHPTREHKKRSTCQSIISLTSSNFVSYLSGTAPSGFINLSASRKGEIFLLHRINQEILHLPIPIVVEWGRWDGWLHFYEAGSGKSCFTIQNLIQEEASCACSSNDGRYLTIGNESGLIRVYRLSQISKSGKVLCEKSNLLRGHNKRITVIRVSNDFGIIVSGDGAGNVFIWDLHNLRYSHVVDSLPSRVDTIAIGGSSGDIFMTCKSDTASVIQLSDVNGKTIKFARREAQDAVCSAEFSSCDGGRLCNIIACGLDRGRIHIFNALDLTFLTEVVNPLPLGPVLTLRFVKNKFRNVLVKLCTFQENQTNEKIGCFQI
eukprot:UC4_evm7s1505